MYRVRIVFDGMPGAPWLSTLYFNETGGTAQQAATAAGTFWGAVDALMDNEVNWTTEGDVTLINSATGNATGVVATTPVTGTGALSTLALPFVAQGLIRWRTGVYVAGRELRGRTFVPALATASNDNGRVLAASVTTMNNAAAALLADANSELVVWSKTHGSASPALTGNAWSQFASLRSRRD